MFGMGSWELIIIFLVVLLVFGAKRIPEMAQGLGKGIKEFRKAVHEVQDEIAMPPASTQIKPPEESVAQGASAAAGAPESQSQTPEKPQASPPAPPA